MKRRSILWILLILELLLFGAASTLAQNDYTTTPNLALKLPKIGSTNWGIYVNGDFTTLDAAIGQFHGGFVAVPFTSTPVFNLTLGNTFQLTLSGNVSSSTVNQPGITSGQFLYLLLCQDATGSRSFIFPASFQTPAPPVSSSPSTCSASTWIWSATFNKWINVSGSGGGGGGTPAAPVGSLQFNNTGNFGATSYQYNASNTTGQFCNDNPCATLVSNIDGSFGIFSSDGKTSAGFAAQSDISPGAVAEAGASVSSFSNIVNSRLVTAFQAEALLGGSNLSGSCFQGGIGSPPCATGYSSLFGDAIGDTTNGQDAVGFSAVPAMNKSTGHNMHSIAGFVMLTPGNYSSSFAFATETTVNLWGLEIQDLQGLGTTMTAGIHIEAQTNPSAHAYSIKVENNGGPAVFDNALANWWGSQSGTLAQTGNIRLNSNDSIAWRNNANNADILLNKSATSSGNLPGDTFELGGGNQGIAANFFADLTGGTSAIASTGILRLNSGSSACWRNNANSADICIAKNTSDAFTMRALVISADQSILWTHGAFTEGFKANASLASNLLWALPLTDSTGTQCLSSNGSGGLAWSNCSAGTGTPGGATGNVQYNSSATFAGSNAFTFNGTGTVGIGQLNTTLGVLNMFGGTSGTITIQPQATAGTATLTLPNTTGTLADGASAPLALSATTGNLTCATCTTNAAAATANQLMIGAGSQAIAALGSLGSTTTVLHGNAGGAPTFAAVNLGTDTTGTTAIANGGTGQTTAAAAFNALSPITSAGDLILGTGVNTAGRLAIGGNGLCLTSNGTTAQWSSCASGAIGGSATAGQGTFWNGTATIAGSANWTYSAASGHTVIQGANAADALYMKRFTDTTPTGSFLHFQNAAANADIFKVDVNGNITGQSLTFNGSVAGGVVLVQGPAPTLVPNALELVAPVSVIAGGEQFVFPGNPSNGFIRWTNVAGVLTGNLVAASGIGTCSGTQLVSQTNDNAAPTCTNVLASMFTTQTANTALLAPNGSNGIPTFRLIATADLPAIVLNSNANGGVTNILQVANGGTGAATANSSFNNLSPMTTAGDIIYGGVAGAATRLAAGTATQLLIGGTTPSWGAVNLATMTTGIAAIANGGTGQATAGAAFNALAPAASANALIYANGTNTWTQLPAGGAGTLCLLETSGGAPTWGSCSGSASTSWSNLANPTADLSLSMGTNLSLFTSGIMTGTRNMWEFVDGNSTSTGSNHFIHTGTSSTMKPITITAQGTANGVQMNTAGLLAPIGTGGISASTTSLTISTTAPLGGGGAFNANLTLTCATCVTSGASLVNNGVVVGSGGGQGVVTIDFPDVKDIPAANCNNTTAGDGWSIGSGGTVTCRAGTNNFGGYIAITDTSSTFATFQVAIPKDWDTATNPYIRVQVSSTDATNAHTIIPSYSVACYKGDGTTTDDVAPNATRSMSTITLNGNANRFWSTSNLQMNSTDMTGCTGGSVMQVTIGRATDTATNAEFYSATITFPRLLVVQAN